MYEKEKRKPIKIFKSNEAKVIAFLLIFLLVLVLVFSWYEKIFQVNEVKKIDTTSITPIGEIYTTIYFNDRADIYSFDLETSRWEKLFKDSDYMSYMPKFSPTEVNKMVFVRGYEDGDYQLLIFDEQIEKYTELTNKGKDFPRNPVFSPDGQKISYWVSDSLDGEPENSSIYIVDLEGKVEKTIKGALPYFISSINLIFLKNDGLHIMDLRTDEEEILLDWLFEDDFGDWRQIRYSFSEKNGLLIITDESLSANYILRVSSWYSFKYDLIVEEEFFGTGKPIFATGEDFFAIERFDAMESLHRLNIVSSKGFVSKGLFEIEVDDILKLEVNDWIVK